MCDSWLSCGLYTASLPRCSLEVKGAEPSVCAHAAHIPSAAGASWQSSAEMRAGCWLGRAHSNTAGERRAAPCQILPANPVTAEWATQKRQLFQCKYIPVGAVPLILTWFSYIVQYVKRTYKGHTCTTQRTENRICASSVQYPAVKRTLNGLKNAEEQSYLGKTRERNQFMIPLSIILFFIIRPSESDCYFWLSLWCRHAERCSPCPEEVFFISEEHVELIY